MLTWQVVARRAIPHFWKCELQQGSMCGALYNAHGWAAVGLLGAVLSALGVLYWLAEVFGPYAA